MQGKRKGRTQRMANSEHKMKNVKVDSYKKVNKRAMKHQE